MVGSSPLVEQVMLPDLVPDAEGIQRAEGVGPRREGVPRGPQRRRRLQHHAPHTFPASHHTSFISSVDRASTPEQDTAKTEQDSGKNAELPVQP